MKSTCILKSHPKGICVVLDNQAPFETLVIDICNAFYEAKEYFGERSMVLSIEGRTLSNEEISVVIDAVELNSDVKVTYVVENEVAKDRRVINALDKYYFEKSEDNAKIYRGNVNPGETLESDTGLLIIGDVKKGGVVLAKGSVAVFGCLEGAVSAGEPDNENAFIIANELLAKSATIAGLRGDINIKIRGGLFTRGNKKEPMVIKLLNGYLHTEPLSSGLVKQDK